MGDTPDDPVDEVLQTAVSEHITDALRDLEDDRDVEVLAARDYGSRVMGTDDPESDYDVIFLYVNPYHEHVSGADTDVIDDPAVGPDYVEFHGWSLRKFVGRDAGILGSNPMALTFVASDLEYYRRDDLDGLDRLCEHAELAFTPYALIRHYRSKAAGNYGKYVEQSWIREWSQDQFAEYAGKPAGQTSIDEERGTVTIGIMGYDEHTIEIPLDEATAEGMIRRTTRDASVKRSLTVGYSLLQARYVEETHDLPPMDWDELTSALESLGVSIPDGLPQLVAEKRMGKGDVEVGNPIGDWVDAELDRDIAPDGHVDRSPDTGVIRSTVEEIVDSL